MKTPANAKWLWITAAVVVVDQVTKLLVVNNLTLYQRIPLLPVLDLVRLPALEIRRYRARPDC